MKIFSYIKAFLSTIIWGLGQLLNRQYLKAIFFFVIFVGFVGIELGTSHYFEETSAYDKLVGNDFGDDWYIEGFMPEYLYNNVSYQPFEDYLVEIGGYENITEESFIKFMADDLNNANPIKYTNLTTGDIFLADDFDATNKIQASLGTTAAFHSATAADSLNQWTGRTITWTTGGSK